MRIFITGASGFVGTALTKTLVAQQHEIFAMARSQQSSEKVQELGATPVTCDLSTVESSDIESCEIVIHSAAYVEEWGNPQVFWDINVEGTSRLLQAAKKAGVKRFIYISTEAVSFYGQHMHDIDETYPYAENSPILYSRTKAEAEKRVLAANDLDSNFATIAIRPRLVWGPGDTTIFPVVKEMVDAGKFMWINQGQVKTTTTYIDNIVHAIQLAFEKGRGGEAYFVTDNENLVVRDFLTKLMATQGVKLPNKSIPKWLVCPLSVVLEKLWRVLRIKSKPPLTRHAAYMMSSDCTINIQKAQQELDYSPVVTVAEGFVKMSDV